MKAPFTGTNHLDICMLFIHAVQCSTGHQIYAINDSTILQINETVIDRLKARREQESQRATGCIFVGTNSLSSAVIPPMGLFQGCAARL